MMQDDYLVLLKVAVNQTRTEYRRFHLEVVASDETRAKAEALRISREEFPNAIVYAVDCMKITEWKPPSKVVQFIKNLFGR